MASAEFIISALKDTIGNPQFDRYDADLCSDIQKKMDSKQIENGWTIAEKTRFVIFCFILKACFSNIVFYNL